MRLSSIWWLFQVDAGAEQMENSQSSQKIMGPRSCMILLVVRHVNLDLFIDNWPRKTYKELTIAVLEQTDYISIKIQQELYSRTTRYGRSSSKEVSKAKFTVNDNPFVKEFKYGINDDGYWTYDYFIIQLLEDCMDILNIIYQPDKFEGQILVDHSCAV